MERLLNLMKIDGHIADDSGEAPDLVIEVGADRIGVEVTEIFQKSYDAGMLPQARETFARQVLAKAKQIYIDAGGRPCSVFVLFSTGHDLRKVQRDTLAHQLAAFVASTEPTPSQLRQWRPTCVDNPLPEVITFVQVYGHPLESQTHHWTAPAAGWVAPLTPRILQSRIDEKSKLLDKYRTRTPVVWLLLVSDSANPSQFFDLPSEEVARSVSSTFNRTFYLAAFKDYAIELGTTQTDAQRIAATDS